MRLRKTSELEREKLVWGMILAPQWLLAAADQGLDFGTGECFPATMRLEMVGRTDGRRQTQELAALSGLSNL
jgi:hypothetical protein